MKTINIIFSGIFAMFVLFFVSATSAYATEGVLISPTTHELIVSPGEQVKSAVIIKNLYQTDLLFNMEAENFSSLNDDGNVILQGNSELISNNNSLAKWITFDTPTGILKPGDTEYLEMTISVPSDASIGGHYAAIFIKKDAQTSTGNQIGLNLRAGSLIMLTVAGDIKKEASFSDLNYKKVITSVGASKYSVNINNIGNTFLKAKTSIEIKSLLGRTSTVNLGEHLVPHGNKVKFEGSWDNPYPFGLYRGKISTSYDDNQSITENFYFWAFPWQTVLPSLLIVIGISTIIFVEINRSKKYNQLINKKDGAFQQ